jgi:hypothetical protein
MGMTAAQYEPERQLKRHPTLETMCGRLEAILHARAAQALLDDEASLPQRAGVVVLPAWSWEISLINVGRKDREFTPGTRKEPGSEPDRLLLPIRNDWSVPLVSVVSGASVPVTYRAVGMGHQMAGQSKLVIRAGEAPLARPAAVPSLAEPVFVGEGSRARTLHALRQLVEAGVKARWELIRDIEPKVTQYIHVAHSAISHEIGLSAGITQPMMDEQGLEQVLNLMMFGEVDEDGKDKPGSVFRLIELCLEADCFVRVDPLKYMGKHLRRDAETEIRRKLGDPHIGPKVRSVAMKHPRADISVIVEEYRKIYPKDRLSITRAQMALSVRPDAMAGFKQLMAVDTRNHPVAEDLEGALA